MRPVRWAAAMFFGAGAAWVGILTAALIRLGAWTAAVYVVGAVLAFLFALAWAAVAHGDV